MKVCIWGNIASSLEGRTEGGGELQIDLLARVLAKSGHEVVIIDPVSTKDFITEEGIKVIQIRGWDNGIKYLRSFTHQIPLLYKSLKEQKADIYYSQIRDFRHVLSYRAAKKTNGKFVLRLASDLDCSSIKLRFKHDYLTNFDGPYWFVKVLLTELIFPKLLRKANMVLSRHEGQKQTLKKKGIESIIFYNILDLNSIPFSENPDRTDFCYVGALDKRKGFVDFFELVSKAPSHHSYKVIGAPRDRTGYYYFEKLKSFPNVKLYGKLSHKETLNHIANSKALISTSPMEGFPNVFIEAWVYGIPVLSLYFDPGDIIKNERLGTIANGNIDKLIDAMNQVKYSEEFAQYAKLFVKNNFALTDEKIKETNELFEYIYNGKN
jgi:glycosyltransferase involved in cell wall biosynthesis